MFCNTEITPKREQDKGNLLSNMSTTLEIEIKLKRDHRTTKKETENMSL